MAGFFSRVKQWIGLENLTYSDLNAEINNIIQKMGADTISGANSTNGSAATVAAMQAQENPGGLGSEVLSTSIQEDIKQLRFQLNALIGQTYWYQSPAQSIGSLNSLINGISYVPSNRIISGRMVTDQPMFLVPSVSANTVTLKATSVNLDTYINGTVYNFTADASLSGMSLAVSSNNTCLVNDATLSGQQSSKAQGERGTFINIDSIGSAITALNGQYAAFKHSTEYFIAEVDTSNNRLKNTWRGVGFDNTDTWVSRTAMSDDDTITLMKLAWIFGLNSGGLDITYNKPSVSYQAPTSPSVGDYWQDLSVQQWKKYNGSSWVNQSAIMLGLCIQDTSHCVCARSFDFFKGYATLNDMELEYVDSTDVRVSRIGTKVSVYGTVWSYDYDFVKWNTTNQLDTGESLSISTTYYCYITDKGDRFISTVQPYDRRFDLLGAYHPAKPWRCVGEFQTDGSSNVTSSSVIFDRYHQFGLPDLYIAGRSIANQTLTRIKIVPSYQQSSAILFSTTSNSFVDVTNATVTITTSGNPVKVYLIGNGDTGTGSQLRGQWTYQILRGATVLQLTAYGGSGAAPLSAVFFKDIVAAGTYTYKLQILATSGTVNVQNCYLIAEEE